MIAAVAPLTLSCAPLFSYRSSSLSPPSFPSSPFSDGSYNTLAALLGLPVGDDLQYHFLAVAMAGKCRTLPARGRRRSLRIFGPDVRQSFHGLRLRPPASANTFFFHCSSLLQHMEHQDRCRKCRVSLPTPPRSRRQPRA